MYCPSKDLTIVQKILTRPFIRALSRHIFCIPDVYLHAHLHAFFDALRSVFDTFRVCHLSSFFFISLRKYAFWCSFDTFHYIFDVFGVFQIHSMQKKCRVLYFCWLYWNELQWCKLCHWNPYNLRFWCRKNCTGLHVV